MTPREERGAGPCALRQSARGGNDAGVPSPQVGIVRGQFGDQPTVQRAEAVVGDGGQVVVERVVTEPDRRGQRAQEPPLERYRVEELSKRVGGPSIALVTVGGEVAGLVEDQRARDDEVPLQEPLDGNPSRHDGGRHQPDQSARRWLLRQPSHDVPTLGGGTPVAWVESEG